MADAECGWQTDPLCKHIKKRKKACKVINGQTSYGKYHTLYTIRWCFREIGTQSTRTHKIIWLRIHTATQPLTYQCGRLDAGVWFCSWCRCRGAADRGRCWCFRGIGTAATRASTAPVHQATRWRHANQKQSFSKGDAIYKWFKYAFLNICMKGA